MSLRFNLIRRSKTLPPKIEKIKHYAISNTPDGDLLKVKDVKNLLLKLREIYYEDSELINIILEELDLRG